jgi:putative transposase
MRWNQRPASVESAPVADVCRQMGVSEASFYVWKKYGQLGLTEIRELRQLRDENTRLKCPNRDLI